MPCEADATDDVSANDVAIKRTNTTKITMRFIAIHLLFPLHRMLARKVSESRTLCNDKCVTLGPVLPRTPLPRTPVNKRGEGLLVPELPEGGVPGLWPRIGA